jgi:pectin methylesterase-like acyl-CoA thioesterase/acetyl esterase/lipase
MVLFAFGADLHASTQTYSKGLHTDIEYHQAAGERLLLDVFVPDGEGPHPVAVFVHGGGWVGGNKKDMHFLCEPLVKIGFTCFSISYRLAPAHRWPACLDDVQTAIRWVKAHAGEFKGDPQRIALIGYSAGGHLVCMAAIQEPVQAVVGIAPPTDHLADSTRRGGLSECMQKLLDRPGKIDAQSKALLKEISPINYVTSQLPPYLLIHGTEDQSVPYQQSIAFRAKLKANAVQCDLITIKGAPHRISDWDTFGIDYRQKMAEWLWRTLGSASQQAASSEIETKTITVSSDGTGDFTTVQAAVDSVEEWNAVPTVIAIAPGTYKEIIVVPRTKRFVTFRGQDAKRTVLTNHLSARMKDENGNELGTFRTPTVTIEADDFTAENITFENSAGDVGQALAVTVIGDRIIFRNCRFLGWQDTLLDQTGRHYYENCYIAGHCDFIFGGGIAFFETCQIHCLSASYITAASTPEHQPYGYVFSGCKITGSPKDSRTYLGRPWRDYASVVFLNTKMSNIVRPEGWHNWNKPHREKTAFYAEYQSIGPGANPSARVDWSHQLTAEQAGQYTLQKVLSGHDGWDPLSGTVQSSQSVRSASPSEVAVLKKK